MIGDTMDDKRRYVIDYLKENQYADILDTNFVDGYCERFDCNVVYMSRGANKVPELSRLLKKMTEDGILSRSTTGINSYSGGYGWPKWVYVYELTGG